MKNMRIKEVLFSEDDIANIVRITAERISSYYKEQNILKTVDGTQPMEKVFADITAILGE